MSGIKLQLVDKKDNAYKNLKLLSDYTAVCTKTHNYKAIKQCFIAAEGLYEKGNSKVKNAVKNVYVFSLSYIFHIDEGERCKLLAIILLTLYRLYVEQLYSFGC